MAVAPQLRTSFARSDNDGNRPLLLREGSVDQSADAGTDEPSPVADVEDQSIGTEQGQSDGQRAG